MPGYALQLYTPRQLMDKLKRNIPKCKVGCRFAQCTGLDQIAIVLWQSVRLQLLTRLLTDRGTCCRVCEQGATKLTHDDNGSNQSLQSRATPPKRLLSMASCLFMLKTRGDPLMTEVRPHALCLSCPASYLLCVQLRS